jgi:CubicO group peptidase (beta-lactamase class C family)
MLALILAVSLPCCNKPGSVSGLSADSLDQAQAKMEAYVDSGELPCVACLVMKDGEIVRQFAYGMANIEEGQPLTDNSIYRIYSMSKPITAAALMILFDEGKFQLDDPVAMHIPVFRDTKVYVDGEVVDQQEPFTVRHLLTHTAGFTYGWEQGSYVDSLYNTLRSDGIWNTATLEEMINAVATVPLKHQPGIPANPVV